MNNRASKAKPNQTSCIAIQGGFDHPEMVEIGKKHKISKRIACVQERFTTDNCYHFEQTIAALLTTVSRSWWSRYLNNPSLATLLRFYALLKKHYLK